MLVTDRDRVVAEMVPPRPDRSPVLADAHLAEAVRQGWLTPPLSRSGTLPERRPDVSRSEILDELGHDRADR